MGNTIKSNGFEPNGEEERKRRREVEEMYFKRLNNHLRSTSSNCSTLSSSPKNDHFLALDRWRKKQLKRYNLKEELHLRIRVPHVIHENKTALSTRYQMIRKLGKGATCTVYVANNLITNEEVAIKFILKSQKIVIDDLELHNEINVLKNLIHPYIVRIFEFYETPVAFYEIAEFCRYGELFAKIERGFTELELSLILYQLFTALCFCHKHNIVHRDLKLENILINDIDRIGDTSQELYWIKLIDFGTAKLLSRNKSEKTIIGTCYYIAPEVLKKNYNEKCDTWSSGVILFILLTGGIPFTGKTDAEMYKKIKTGNFQCKQKKFVNASLECQDLISRLLEVNIENRLSTIEALNHPWFIKLKTREVMNKIDAEKAHRFASNLIQYKVNSKLHQLIIAFLAHNSLEIRELRDILKLFGLMDFEEKGRLTKDDLLNGLIAHGIDKEEATEKIEELFMMLDSDNNGYLVYEEFVRGAMDKSRLLTEKMLQLAFQFLAKGDNTTLSVKSIKDAFASVNRELSDDLCKKMLFEMNPDSGEITFEYFKAFMKCN